jgi:hypothetical protein
VAKSGDAVLIRVGGSWSKICWLTGWLMGFGEDLRQSMVVLLFQVFLAGDRRYSIL